MEVLKAINKRHMCRNFNPTTKVKLELIEELINAGKKAPSAGGLRVQVFAVIEEETKKENISKLTFNQKFEVSDASVIIVISSNIEIVFEKYGERGVNFFLHKIVLLLLKTYFF